MKVAMLFSVLGTGLLVLAAWLVWAPLGVAALGAAFAALGMGLREEHHKR